MGSSGVAAFLRAASILLKVDKGWDWFICLSALDYPLIMQDEAPQKYLQVVLLFTAKLPTFLNVEAFGGINFQHFSVQRLTALHGRPLAEKRQAEASYELIEARRLSKQRRNRLQQGRGNIVAGPPTPPAACPPALLINRPGEGSAAETPHQRGHIDKKKREFAAANAKLDIGDHDQYVRTADHLFGRRNLQEDM
ncbi:hypothetical protein AgCh_019792 [Apium graveolens]